MFQVMRLKEEDEVTLVFDDGDQALGARGQCGGRVSWS